MANDRMSKVNELIKNQIALALYDIFPDEFISVTQVQVSKDLSYAKVWIAALENGNQIIKHLQSKASLIQRNISKKIVLKKVPSLHFVIDKTEGQADKIDKILDDLKKEGEV